MAIGFSALFAAMIAERISNLLVTHAAPAVRLRRRGERRDVAALRERGAGDLRFYLFVQLFPMIALPLMMLLFKPRYSRGLELFIVVLIYAAAKALEHFDKQIWRRRRIPSAATRSSTWSPRSRPGSCSTC